MAQKQFTALTFTRKRKGVLKEEFSDGSWNMMLDEKKLVMYTISGLSLEPSVKPYGGFKPEELLASGQDLLGKELLKNGEPDFTEVSQILPPIGEGAYAFLGSPISWSGVTINLETGSIYPQMCASDWEPVPIFAPVMEDIDLSNKKPKISLLGGKYPVMISVHTDGENVLEFLYFVEAGDTNRDPVVWIRTKRYALCKPEHFTVSYKIAAKSRPVQNRLIAEDTFLTAFSDTVAFWLAFEKEGAELMLPEKTLERVASGNMMSCAVTFAGDHAHYGHKIYGEEIHDNFPPNYCWALEASCLAGRTRWAKRMFAHVLTYVLSDEGCFFYRQGEEEIFGASAEEYGQLLFLADRYRTQLGFTEWTESDWQKIVGMGQVIKDSIAPCEDFGGEKLIMMCAEADTNTRIHAYLNNNLWGIRGLYALSALLKEKGDTVRADDFKKEAEELLETVNRLLKSDLVNQTRFGKLPPFRVGYTETPATLSICRDTFFDMTEAEMEDYLVPTFMRSSKTKAQDLSENTYANYRYYPEMLSAMYLPEEQAKAIVNMREAIGGEYMGMIRFMGHVDDWPIVHYARYLLETENIDKYLLILYAHTCHHGHPELMCYYEQVLPGVKPIQNDCVPSLLTTPIMIYWMFAYETMNEKRLSLLRGVPKAWFSKGFLAKGIGYSEGKVDLIMQDNTLSLSFSKETTSETEVVWRSKAVVKEEDILFGKEWISRIDGNKLYLKKGLRNTTISLQA